jgi:hypothetical protein
MFTSVENTRALTGYDVTLDLVNQAQGIIESYLGKTEAEIESPDDLTIIGRATAYQAAYMKVNSVTVYEQIAVRSIAQADGGVVVDRDMISPWIAPLAFIALKAVSWKGSRSIKTGPINDRPSELSDWSTN